MNNLGSTYTPCKSRNRKYLWENGSFCFDTVKSAAKLGEAVGTLLKNVEDVCSHYYFANVNIALLERSRDAATEEILQ